MKKTFQNIIEYLKNPVLETDLNTNLNYRFKIFFQILIICILTSYIITPLYSIIEYLKLVDMGSHKAEKMFKDLNVFQILLTASLVVPILEELIFRGPITLFRKAKPFKYMFYTSSIIFGFIHIFNFEITTNVLLLSPLLVLPQLLVGSYFGYIRVKFGLFWSILLHGSYNGILFSLSFIFDK